MLDLRRGHNVSRFETVILSDLERSQCDTTICHSFLSNSDPFWWKACQRAI